jgi:hypothetical protein
VKLDSVLFTSGANVGARRLARVLSIGAITNEGRVPFSREEPDVFRLDLRRDRVAI